MSKVTTSLKAIGMIGTMWIATYGWYQLWEIVANKIPVWYYLPEIIQGFIACTSWNIARLLLRKIVFNSSELTEREVRSLASLQAFVNTTNIHRNVSIEDSLKNMQDNLLQIELYQWSNKIAKWSWLLVTTDGYIITAYHVVKPMVNSQWKIHWKIRLQNGQSYTLSNRSILLYNENLDTVILKVDVPNLLSKPTKILLDADQKIDLKEEVRVMWFKDGQVYNSIWVVTKFHQKSLVSWQELFDLFETDVKWRDWQSWWIIANSRGELIWLIVYSNKEKWENIWVIWGTKIRYALQHISDVLSQKNTTLFTKIFALFSI
jgi:hypothetical protein